MLIEIDGLDLPQLEEFTNLTDVALRRVLEPKQGIFIAESFNVIERAIQAGIEPLKFLVSPHWLPKLEAMLRRNFTAVQIEQLPIFLGEESVLENITGFHLHRGAIAAMRRPQLPAAAQALGMPGVRRVLILEDLVDHTNVGACFRSAAALGIDLVLVTPSCADPLYRRAVRVSMGTVFQVPWTRIAPWPHTQVLEEAGFHVAALALSDTAVPLDEFARSNIVCSSDSKLALVMGAEGDGLKTNTIKSAHSVVKIPMRGEVDSLNVAAASAVAIWAMRPQ